LKKSIEPRQFITGNFMGYGFDSFDHYVMSKPLTFVSWDDYVGHGHLDPDSNGISHDAMRGLKRENIWIIETQPGFVNWSGLNNALNKGEVRAMAWHDIGHGADEVGYWQWRSALNGQEELQWYAVGARRRAGNSARRSNANGEGVCGSTKRVSRDARRIASGAAERLRQ
jgi:beta-galactosidase